MYQAHHEVASADVGGPIERQKCRNGHVLTHKNTKRNGDGYLRCLDCRERHLEHHTVPCAGCHEPFVRGLSPYCPRCRAERDAARAAKDRRAEPPKKGGTVTRVCAACHERKALQEHFRVPNWHQTTHAGQPQYRDTCTACHLEQQGDDEVGDAPYEVARLEIEQTFGIPSAEWMTKRDHPLNVLHFSRMVSLNNATLSRPGAEPIAVGPIWNEAHAWALVNRAGYRPIQEKAA